MRPATGPGSSRSTSARQPPLPTSSGRGRRRCSSSCGAWCRFSLGGRVVSKLERLAALRTAGALTDQEFTDQKRRILAG
uniref:SHOCT domain-containing protein n=1 Tax=Geminicoccus flavidas TaxID=2506407 RepID=UPI00135AA9A3